MTNLVAILATIHHPLFSHASTLLPENRFSFLLRVEWVLLEKPALMTPISSTVPSPGGLLHLVCLKGAEIYVG